jgi:hypothetical protein
MQRPAGLRRVPPLPVAARGSERRRGHPRQGGIGKTALPGTPLVMPRDSAWRGSPATSARWRAWLAGPSPSGAAPSLMRRRTATPRRAALSRRRAPVTIHPPGGSNSAEPAGYDGLVLRLRHARSMLSTQSGGTDWSTSTAAAPCAAPRFIASRMSCPASSAAIKPAANASPAPVASTCRALRPAT